jgi:signal transduction histidine kinase
VTLRITDDGSGWDPEVLSQERYREVLENFEAIRDRASMMGGVMRVKTQPGKGTVLDIALPSSPPAE